MKVKCKVNASLALIKYWGKKDAFLNIPATSSLAVSVDKFYSISELELSDQDEIILNSKPVVFQNREKVFLIMQEKFLVNRMLDLKLKVKTIFQQQQALQAQVQVLLLLLLVF